MKKYGKKLVAAAMAMAMVMPMSGISAMAADIIDKTEDTENGKTTVTYSVTQTYTWSVPTAITFQNNTGSTITAVADGEAGADNQKVMVTKNVIPAGKKLQISAAGGGNEKKFIIASDEGKELAYTLKAGTNEESASDVNSGGVVLSVDAGTNVGSAVLVFTLTKDGIERAGNYSGTVIYTASITD